MAPGPARLRRWRLDGAGGTARVQVTISAGAVDFARLAANRRSPRTLPHTVTGDHALAQAILRAAATLGCD